MKRWEVVLLVLLFVIPLAARLYFVSSTEYFSPDAYFPIRLTEHIAEHGIPLHDDALSYGGRTLLVPPLFPYLLAFFSFIFPASFVFKVVPQLFISLLPIVIFFIVQRVTARSDAAFFSAVLSAFIPIIFSKTLFSVTPLALALPLTFFALLLFISPPRKTTLVLFIISVVALSLLHPSSIFLVTGLLGYLILSRIESIHLEKSELELIFFSTFISLWIQFLLYEKAFLMHGFALVRQNIPPAILSTYFTDVSLFSALIQIGVIPLVGGILCVYKYILKIKNKYIYMYIAQAISLIIFIWLRFIPPPLGFMYLGVCLCILSGPSYISFVSYVKKTRFLHASSLALCGIILLIVLSLVVPSMYFARTERDATVSPSLYMAMLWLNNRTQSGSTILAAAPEGHLIAAVAERKNVLDDYFILAPHSDERLVDVGRMFTSLFPTEAVALFEKYSVDYILITNTTMTLYGVRDLPYRDASCLSRVYDRGDVRIYRSRCDIEVTEQ